MQWKLLLVFACVATACSSRRGGETSPSDETYTSGDEFDRDEPPVPLPDDPL